MIWKKSENSGTNIIEQRKRQIHYLDTAKITDDQ